MKFVKVTALAAAMAASFGAQAELAAMDDEALEAVTGQAGITIEQSISTVDISYTDYDGATVGTIASNGGTILIDNLQVVSTTDLTTAGSITMAIDVVSNTPAGANNAIAINQQFSTNAGLYIEDIRIGTTGATAFSDANVLAGNTSAAGATGLGSVVVSGLNTTMYVYAR